MDKSARMVRSSIRPSISGTCISSLTLCSAARVDEPEGEVLERLVLAAALELGDSCCEPSSVSSLRLMLMFQADFAAARTHFERALALRGGKRDNMLDAWLFRGLGVLSGSEGDAISARRLLEQALAVFRTHGDVGACVLHSSASLKGEQLTVATRSYGRVRRR